MKTNTLKVGELVAIHQFAYGPKKDSPYACSSDDDCSCDGPDGSCECGYDPGCES